MRLKFILNAPAQLESGVVLLACVGCYVKGFPCVVIVAGREFPKFDDWLDVQ